MSGGAIKSMSRGAPARKMMRMASDDEDSCEDEEEMVLEKSSAMRSRPVIKKKMAKATVAKNTLKDAECFKGGMKKESLNMASLSKGKELEMDYADDFALNEESAPMKLAKKISSGPQVDVNKEFSSYAVSSCLNKIKKKKK